MTDITKIFVTLIKRFEFEIKVMTVQSLPHNGSKRKSSSLQGRAFESWSGNSTRRHFCGYTTKAKLTRAIVCCTVVLRKKSVMVDAARKNLIISIFKAIHFSSKFRQRIDQEVKIASQKL